MLGWPDDRGVGPVRRAEGMKELGAKVSKSLPENLVEMHRPELQLVSQEAAKDSNQEPGQGFFKWLDKALSR